MYILLNLGTAKLFVLLIDRLVTLRILFPKLSMLLYLLINSRERISLLLKET
jgi:hypothetical protein